MKKKPNRRQRKSSSSQTLWGRIYKAQDQGAKAILGNPELMAQLLRDYIPLPGLKEIKAEDIEDVSERFIPLNQEGRDSDIIKRVHLAGQPIFIISLLEHKAQVDFRAPFKMLQYITLLWADYEKEADQKDPGASHRKGFRFPPVLPIIYYEGADRWSAAMNMKDRVSMAEIFSKYIPDFEYELIQVHDYTTLELVEKGNGLSLIMLVNQLKSAEDFIRLQEIPPDYFKNLEKKSSGEILKILSQVMTLLLRRLNVPLKEIHSVTDKIWKGEIDMMFDSFQGYDVQKVRKESIRIGKAEGIAEGEVKGEARGEARGIVAMISDNLEENISEERIILKLKKHFLLDDRTAKEYLEKYHVINK